MEYFFFLNSQKSPFFEAVKLVVPLKVMDLTDHVTSVIAITVSKVIQKLITIIDFSWQTDLGSFSHVCLAPRIHFNYYFSSNLTYCNCNYPMSGGPVGPWP